MSSSFGFYYLVVWFAGLISISSLFCAYFFVKRELSSYKGKIKNKLIQDLTSIDDLKLSFRTMRMLIVENFVNERKKNKKNIQPITNQTDVYEFLLSHVNQETLNILYSFSRFFPDSNELKYSDLDDVQFSIVNSHMAELFVLLSKNCRNISASNLRFYLEEFFKHSPTILRERIQNNKRLSILQSENNIQQKEPPVKISLQSKRKIKRASKRKKMALITSSENLEVPVRFEDGVNNHYSQQKQTEVIGDKQEKQLNEERKIRT